MVVSGGGRGISRFQLRAPLKFKRIYRVGGESEVKDGLIKELGLKDLLFEAKEELPVDSRVYLEFKLPTGHEIKTECIVVSCKKEEGEGDFYLVEARFLSLNPKDATAIDMVGYREWMKRREMAPYMRIIRTPYEPESEKKKKI